MCHFNKKWLSCGNRYKCVKAILPIVGMMAASTESIDNLLEKAFATHFPKERTDGQYYALISDAVLREQEIPPVHSDYHNYVGKDVLTKDRALKLAKDYLHSYSLNTQQNKAEVVDSVRFYLEAAGEGEMALRAVDFTNVAYQCCIAKRRKEFDETVQEGNEAKILAKCSELYALGPEEVQDYVLTAFVQYKEESRQK